MSKIKLDLDDPKTVDFAKRIAELLGEDKPHAQRCIVVLVALNGQNTVGGWLREIGELKQRGVVWKTDDFTRDRTLGGMFFKLAKDRMTPTKLNQYKIVVNTKKYKKERQNAKK